MATEAPAALLFTYADVQAILRGAAPPDGGDDPHSAFWEFELPHFLAATVMGLPLVEPAKAAGNCCGQDNVASGRGARSALVRGLRGEAPFDGTQFPRLPWGGSAVDPADIDRIEAWIDEGCPGALIDSLSLADEVSVPAEPELRVTGSAGPVFSPSDDPGAYRYAKGELRQRVEIDSMTEPQLERLRCAFRELYALNKWPGDKRSYNNLALIHQNHCQHGWERFLPWHRIYLYEFEQVLQDFCPDVTMPWWDFTSDAYKPDDPTNGEIIPKSFKAFLTPVSVRTLEGQGFPKGSLDSLVLVPFAQMSCFLKEVEKATGDPKYVKGAYRERLIDALLDANALWYPLRYPAQYEGGGTINTVIHYHYPRPEDIDEIMSLRTFRDFGGGSLYVDSFGFLDQNPHNTMHIWTGGQNPDAPKTVKTSAELDRNRAVRVAGRKFHQRDDLYSQPASGDMLSNLTASYDPIFWPIHANIDRLWGKWQQDHPEGLPADLDSALTPWSYAVRDTLDMHRFGYEYVRASSIVPVGLANPVGRFVSAPLAVSEAARRGFRSAEVRLHRVPQLPRSCFIRVFLNTPDADASTPLTHEGYAGYAAVFGHGECYGGPGHCALPPDENRKFDLRERSMNAPRNHRIDVTRAARRLLAAGSTTLTVSLVVIGASYQEDLELLRLDGVSLNFLD